MRAKIREFIRESDRILYPLNTRLLAALLLFIPLYIVIALLAKSHA